MKIADWLKRRGEVDSDIRIVLWEREVYWNGNVWAVRELTERGWKVLYTTPDEELAMSYLHQGEGYEKW